MHQGNCPVTHIAACRETVPFATLCNGERERRATKAMCVACMWHSSCTQAEDLFYHAMAFKVTRVTWLDVRESDPVHAAGYGQRRELRVAVDKETQKGDKT